jgi:hypothetical protein
MSVTDPPTGVPELDEKAGDYIYSHIHKPEIAEFIENLYARK